MATIIDADAFTTDTIVVAERPRASVTIGSKKYVARAPKIDTWRECALQMAQLDMAKELAASEELTAEEEAKLDALMMTPERHEELTRVVITGVDVVDDDGNVVAREGGFLRRCLSPEDWQSVYAEWKSDTSDLESDHLLIAAFALLKAFQGHFNEREQASGLSVSKPKARKARKPQAR